MGTSRASKNELYKRMGKPQFSSAFRKIKKLGLQIASIPARLKLGKEKTNKAIQELLK